MHYTVRKHLQRIALCMDFSDAISYAQTSKTHPAVHGHRQRILLCMENQTGIHISRNLAFREESKRTATNCGFLREEIQDRTIIICRVKSDEKLGDILTMAFTNSLCVFIRDKFGFIDIHKLNIKGRVRNDENANRTTFEVE